MGDKPSYPKVSGTVTFDGKPLPSGTVTLMPVDLKNSSASGVIDANGQFQLGTHAVGDGCAAGEYEVAVLSWETEPTMGTPGKSRIPDKYSKPKVSKLTQKITDAASQTIKIDLTK